MTRLVLPANPIADDRADLLIAGREVLAEGFRRYERLRVRRSGENVPRPLDVLRSGAAAAVLRSTRAETRSCCCDSFA